MNSSALLSSLPKSFPMPIEGRNDFFSFDPKSFTYEQLNVYRKEIGQLIKLEKANLEKMRKYSNGRIKIYVQAIELAEKNQMNSNNFHLPMKINCHSSIDYIDPKCLTNTQLQLYIQGITEEIVYEKSLLTQFENETTSRLDIYELGVRTAELELSLRKEK